MVIKHSPMTAETNKYNATAYDQTKVQASTIFNILKLADTLLVSQVCASPYDGSKKGVPNRAESPKGDRAGGWECAKRFAQKVGLPAPPGPPGHRVSCPGAIKDTGPGRVARPAQYPVSWAETRGSGVTSSPPSTHLQSSCWFFAFPPPPHPPESKIITDLIAD